MKKLVIVFATVFFALISNAQNEDFRFTGTINQGNSFMGIVFRSAGLSKNIDTYATPALQATFDVGIKKWLSVGAAFSLQKMGAHIYDYEIDTHIDSIVLTQDVDIDLKRLNISSRALFHYGNKGKIDMYSGLRLGYHRYSIEHNTTLILYDILSDYKKFERVIKWMKIKADDAVNPLTRNKFGWQIVLFGFRYNFAEYAGINLELAIGKPHFFSAGVCYRF
jgi:hypothetical protein